MASPMWLNRPSKTREFRGPFPHSVLLLGRPIDPDVYERELIRRQKVDKVIDEHDEGEDFVKLQKRTALRDEFVKLTDRKVNAKVARAKVRDHMLIYSIGVEQRRERLKELLAKEDQQYRVESDALEETLMTRLERNRAKIKKYREKKEAERLQFVQEKLMHQMAASSDEVRNHLSKRLLLDAAADRVDQMKAKEESKKEEKLIDEIYKRYDQFDHEARARREEMEAQEVLRQKCDQILILQKQMAAKDDQKRKEQELKKQEEEFLTEQRELWKIEDENVKMQKLREKTELRDLYNRILRSNHERRTDELKSELVFDMKMIEENLKWKSDEEYQALMNKKLTREEALKYLKYLEEERQEKAKIEKQFEEFRQCEVKKILAEQDRKWRLAKEARDRLRCDVAAAVNKQRENREQEKAEEKLRDCEFTRRIDQGIVEAKRIENERQRRRQEENRDYGDDLVCQIDYNNRQRKAAEEEHLRMIEKQNEAEQEYQRKIVDLLNDPSLTRTHPARLKLCKYLQMEGPC